MWWQNYVWISKVIFSTRSSPTTLVSLTYCGFYFSLKWKMRLVSQYSQDLKVSEYPKQTKREKSQYLWGVHSIYKNMKITKKMNTISKQCFIFNYPNFRGKYKPCGTLIFFFKFWTCVSLAYWMAKVKILQTAAHSL